MWGVGGRPLSEVPGQRVLFEGPRSGPLPGGGEGGPKRLTSPLGETGSVCEPPVHFPKEVAAGP